MPLWAAAAPNNIDVIVESFSYDNEEFKSTNTNSDCLTGFDLLDF